MDSVGKTVGVAAALCIVCSILVSAAAVKLKPIQTKNAELDMKKNILSAAGLFKDNDSIEEIYSAKVVEKVIELENGSVTNIDPKTFDLRKAEQHPEKSIKIQNDFAMLGRRAKQSNIYLIKGDQGIDGVILPVKSQGLWAIMYGFLALEKDGVTVKGFQYYSQAETPGLGAEVDNPKWKAQWIGKKVYNTDFKPEISLVKTMIDPSSEMAKHQIDALSGATITTNGVQNSLRYWLGEDGYGKFLTQYRQGVQL
jgi:Na+-transporting NADH:ubiquinone oxidoreductase subunit C